MHIAVGNVQCGGIAAKSAVVIDQFLGIIHLEFIIRIDAAAQGQAKQQHQTQQGYAPE